MYTLWRALHCAQRNNNNSNNNNAANLASRTNRQTDKHKLTHTYTDIGHGMQFESACVCRTCGCFLLVSPMVIVVVVVVVGPPPHDHPRLPVCLSCCCSLSGEIFTKSPATTTTTTRQMKRVLSPVQSGHLFPMNRRRILLSFPSSFFEPTTATTSSLVPLLKRVRKFLKEQLLMECSVLFLLPFRGRKPE